MKTKFGAIALISIALAGFSAAGENDTQYLVVNGKNVPLSTIESGFNNCGFSSGPTNSSIFGGYNQYHENFPSLGKFSAELDFINGLNPNLKKQADLAFITARDNLEKVLNSLNKIKNQQATGRTSNISNNQSNRDYINGVIQDQKKQLQKEADYVRKKAMDDAKRHLHSDYVPYQVIVDEDGTETVIQEVRSSLNLHQDCVKFWDITKDLAQWQIKNLETKFAQLKAKQ